MSRPAATARRRAVATLLLPGAFVLVAVAVPVAAWSSLPEPMAIHWNYDGTPDGSASRLAHVLLVGGLGVVGVVIARLGAVMTRDPMAAPVTVFTGTFLAALSAIVSVATVTANSGAPRWDEAADLPLPLALSLAVLAAGPGLLAARLVPRPARRPEPDDAVTPTATAGLKPGEQATVAATVTMRWPLAVAVLGLGVSVAVGPRSAAMIAIAVGVALVVSAFAVVRVVVDRRGLTVAFGPWRWPRLRIPLDEIEAADAIDLEPMAWGGWGYRGSMKLAGRAAVVLRRGEALRVQRAGDRLFAVTMPEAERAAGLLNDLVAQRR